MSFFRYLFYDTQVKLFCVLLIFLLASIYFIIAISFPDCLPLFPNNLNEEEVNRINTVTINLSYSLSVSIITYILTITIPTIIRLKKGYDFTVIHFKSFLDSWICLYCLLKYSLLIISKDGDEDPYVKMYETDNLEEMRKLVDFNKFQVWNNTGKLIIQIEHFLSIFSKNENNIPSFIYQNISRLDTDLLPTLKWELNLLEKDLTLSEVSACLKPYIPTIDKLFRVFRQCEILFIGKSIMKNSKIISGIKLNVTS